MSTGGPAFPTYHGGYAKCDADGMTLRDYFAAQAMQVLLQTTNGIVGVNRYEHQVARTAYDIADAMLIARQV